MRKKGETQKENRPENSNPSAGRRNLRREGGQRGREFERGKWKWKWRERYIQRRKNKIIIKKGLKKGVKWD